MWGLLLPTYFIVFFHRTALSTIGDPLAQALGLHDNVGVALGSLAGIYFAVYACLQIVSGVVADTLGARIAVSVGCAVMGVAAIAFAYAPSLGAAMTARFFVGLGASFNFIALLRQQVNWFDKKDFARLTGYTAVAGNSGALFGIGPFVLLVAALGWRQAYLVPAVVSIAFAAVIAIFVRNAPAGAKPSGEQGFVAGLRAVAANPANYLTFVAFGFTAGVYMTFTGFWGVPFLVHVYGLSTAQASVSVTMVTLGVVIGSPVTPVFARRFGSARRGGIFMFTVCAALWAVVFFAPLPMGNVLARVGLFFAVGFFLSAFILPYTTVRENNPESAMGTALAFTNTGGFAAVAVLQVVVGVILDASVAGGGGQGMPVYPAHAYHVAFGLLLGLFVAGIWAYVLVKERVSCEPGPPCA
jgi:sugar phosphate permease